MPTFCGIKKDTENGIDTSKVVGQEINVEKTQYMVLSHLQNEGQNHEMKIVNRAFENVAQFRYLIMTVKKKTPWPLVRKQTIPTERPPLVDEI
jgi:hypothetical protein